MLYAHNGRQWVQRQTKTWNDYVRENLYATGHAYDWWKKCKDREEWKSVIQVVLGVPSP